MEKVRDNTEKYSLGKTHCLAISLLIYIQKTKTQRKYYVPHELLTLACITNEEVITFL